MKYKFTLLFEILIISLIGIISAAHSTPTDWVTNDTGLMKGMGDWAYNVTGGIFWTLILLWFCLVMFTSTVRYGADKAFGFAGTVGLFGSITLMIIGWIPYMYGALFIIVGAISIALMIKSKAY